MSGRRCGLEDIVAARSVAVIGASRDPSRIGGRPIPFLRASGFTGHVYPVNAKYTEVQGLACYPSLASVSGDVDVAIVSVPARDVVGVLEACRAKGVKAAIVFSSGFGETGEHGQALQRKVAEAARRTGVRVLGPNCQGLVAVRQHLNLSFSSAFGERIVPGPVALVAESGAIGGMLASLLGERGVGLSYWVSSGNEVDVDVPECIEFFASDPDTRVIAAYVENMRSGRRLLDAVAVAGAAGKPVVLLRAGRSPQSARAARSHTGAVAAENRVAAALLSQAGAIEAHGIQELLDTVYAFARISGRVGRRVGILTNSGGLGVIMADTCADLGLDVPPFPDAVQGDLRAFLPEFGATGNPVDVTAQVVSDQTLLPRALDVMLSLSEIDVLVVALAMVNRMYPVEAIVGDLVRGIGRATKPVLVTWVSGAPEGAAAIDAAGIPVYADATRCLKALAGLAAKTAPAPGAGRPPSGASRGATRAAALLAAANAGALDEHDSKAVLACYEVPVIAERRVTSADAAVAAAEELGYPVAVKACAREITHKSEHGLLELALEDEASVRRAGAAIRSRLPARLRAGSHFALLVQRMAPPGVEVVLGAKRDAVFGPVVMVGLGGVFIEYLDDVALAAAPVDADRALVMLRSLRAWPLLAGARGRPPADVDALAAAVAAVSRLAVDFDATIGEVDVNPLVTLPAGQGVVAVDALIVVDRVGGR